VRIPYCESKRGILIKTSEAILLRDIQLALSAFILLAKIVFLQQVDLTELDHNLVMKSAFHGHQSNLR
jgi:hypothetical protein